MKIKTHQFCSLCTSPSWQAWLYHFNSNIYRSFINKLQQITGCTKHRELMIETLREIESQDGSDKLYDFISAHYPHMIEGEIIKNVNSKQNNGKVFDYYRPGMLTYPRRIIFDGSPREIKKQIASFVLDKIKHDSIIVGDRGYVEYLIDADKHLLKQIPDSNWQIPLYRLRNNGVQ